MQKKFKLLEKWEEMTKYGYIALQQYPKSEKFTLAKDTRDCLWNMGINILSANNAQKKQDREDYAKKADAELIKLRLLTRMGMKLHYLPFNKYEHLNRMIVETGKMMGGWLRWMSK